MKKYKICMIGSGYMAEKHCSVLMNHPQAELTELVMSPTNTTSSQFSEKYHFEKVYSDLTQAVDSEIYIICSPNNFHAEQVIYILNKGKNVLCEKPLAYTEKEMQNICKAKDNSSGKLQVGMNCRYRVQYSGIKKILDEGKIGTVTFIRGTYIFNLVPVLKNKEKKWWYNFPEGSFNFLHTGAIHSLDLMRWFGGNIKDVNAFGNAYELISEWQKDIFTVNIQYESGAIGNFICTASSLTPPDFSFEIWGSDGYIKGKDVYLKTNDGLIHSEISLKQVKPDLELQFNDFIECIQSGKEPMNSYEEAYKNFQFILSIEEFVRKSERVN